MTWKSVQTSDRQRTFRNSTTWLNLTEINCFWQCFEKVLLQIEFSTKFDISKQIRLLVQPIPPTFCNEERVANVANIRDLCIKLLMLKWHSNGRNTITIILTLFAKNGHMVNSFITLSTLYYIWKGQSEYVDAFSPIRTEAGTGLKSTILFHNLKHIFIIILHFVG